MEGDGIANSNRVQMSTESKKAAPLKKRYQTLKVKKRRK